MKKVVSDHANERYLPGVSFPDNLHPELDLSACLDKVRDILIVVPSHGLRETLKTIKPMLEADVRICWATKGFELSTGELPHQVAEDVLGADRPMAVLSGPTFAKEVAAGLPTAMTIAANDRDFASDLAEEISGANFRAYTADDMIGVEVGAAVKYVLAIGAGLSDGLGFGANARIAMINRGLVEMTRLGIALGAKQETFMGLAGAGDLILTCTDNLSRNRRVGLGLGEGRKLPDILRELGQEAEGVATARELYALAKRMDVDMPITEQVYRVLYEDRPPKQAVEALLSREPRKE